MADTNKIKQPAKGEPPTAPIDTPRDKSGSAPPAIDRPPRSGDAADMPKTGNADDK